MVQSKLKDKTPKQKGPGRPKDESKSQAIMDAAGKLFMSKGMAHVTMDDIAAEAGVSKLTIYNHMGTKEELFETMLRNRCESHMNEALFEGLDCQDVRADLEKIGHGFIDIIYSPEALAMHRTVMSEARNGQEIPTLFYNTAPQRVFDYLEKYLARLEKNSMFKFSDKRRAADIFFSLFQGDTHT